MKSLKGGEYRICEKIGDGGFGKVFRGFWIRNGREEEVAIKSCPLLKPGDPSSKPDPREEARILKQLSRIHDAKHVIAKYYDSFSEGDKYYLVMELCKHGSIYDYLNRERRKPFNEEQTRDILLSILTALDIIHSAGYVHRDLSPKNIIIHSFSNDSVPQIRIVDFGLSKQKKYIKNTVAGTPGFFAPDMMRDGYSIDVDFYALGCIMYFMLTTELISSKTKNYNRCDVEKRLNLQGISQEATDLVLFLTDDNNCIRNSGEIKIQPFFTNDYMKVARLQASNILKSASNVERSPFQNLTNQATARVEQEKRYAPSNNRYRSASHAKSLPVKFVPRHPSKLSVATSNSPLQWPLPPEFKHIVKNVMVNKFGRALLRGPDRLFICETLNFNENNRCTYVGRLINACSRDQELRLYQPISKILLLDFNTCVDGIPESELKLICQITRASDLERKDAVAAQAMYSKMRSILRAVCEMVRKREENPNLIVDTLAKVTWGGMISVELSNKQVIQWSCRSRGPPLHSYPWLTEDEQDMLKNVHEDFSRLFVTRE